MRLASLKERMAILDEEYARFDRIETKTTQRPDLLALILLDRLLPRCGEEDIICAAEHDQIWLDVDVERLNEIIADEDLRTLVRCGVRYDEQNDALSLFI